ncbi:ABC-2 type transporter [Magnetospirillum sp. LM-5]|uniref:ABC transporter permease n=1 Tax=Magnetospirillum sp. LM-5 TaxID=2681466 RepID=UPI0013849172|nr:ABC transporter permease [Magnetospirillum sp. LM-5]CAA7619097.1 ABC-2 type transporter [Magnetospirillum sp. LM-5]
MIRIIHPVHVARAFVEGVTIVAARRHLIVALTKREIGEQYAGQMLGAYWSLMHPLIHMAVYIFVFNFIFNARIGGTADIPLDFAGYMMSGLLPWLSTQQAMIRSCSALTGSANLVKQVVFPIEVLPIKVVLAVVPGQVVTLTIMIAYAIIVAGIPPATYLLLPVLALAQLLLMLGIAFALAIVGALLRDIKDIIQVLTLVAIYTMPVFYLPDWVPQMLRPILYFNPFSYMTWCYQDALFYGRIEHPIAWIVFMGGSVLVFVTGYRMFRRLRPWVGNVL